MKFLNWFKKNKDEEKKELLEIYQECLKLSKLTIDTLTKTVKENTDYIDSILEYHRCIIASFMITVGKTKIELSKELLQKIIDGNSGLKLQIVQSEDGKSWEYTLESGDIID